MTHPLGSKVKKYDYFNKRLSAWPWVESLYYEDVVPAISPATEEQL